MNRFLALLLLIFFSHPAFAAGTAYFSALEELPVAPGMTEEAQSAVRFDQPEGRIIVLQALGRMGEPEISAFYGKTLPALGWKAMGGNRYARGGEILSLEVRPLENAGRGAGNRLNILLRPQ